MCFPVPAQDLAIGEESLVRKAGGIWGTVYTEMGFHPEASDEPVLSLSREIAWSYLDLKDHSGHSRAHTCTHMHMHCREPN